MYEEIEGLFASSFAVQSEAEANRIIAEQRQLWPNLLQKIRRGLEASGETQALSAIDHLSTQIQNMGGMFERPHDPRKGFVISGLVPLLTRSGTVLDQFVLQRPYDMLAAIITEGGQQLLDVVRGTGLHPSALHALFSPPTQLAITRYMLAKTDSGIRQQLNSSVEAALSEHASALQKNAEASDEALKELQAKMSSF
jgi:hypothetical protein